jgi:hypothetical protein
LYPLEAVKSLRSARQESYLLSPMMWPWINGYASRVPPICVERWIAASGIDSYEALTRLAGYDAALIGSALMADENPAQALRQLLGNDSALLI